jgi:hypothetical protein
VSTELVTVADAVVIGVSVGIIDVIKNLPLIGHSVAVAIDEGAERIDFDRADVGTIAAGSVGPMRGVGNARKTALIVDKSEAVAAIQRRAVAARSERVA